MEKVRPWCGQPSDRGRLRNRTGLLTEGRVGRTGGTGERRGEEGAFSSSKFATTPLDIRRITKQPSLSSTFNLVVSLSLGILHEWMRTQAIFELPADKWSNTGAAVHYLDEEPVRWMLGYMRSGGNSASQAISVCIYLQRLCREQQFFALPFSPSAQIPRLRHRHYVIQPTYPLADWSSKSAKIIKKVILPTITLPECQRDAE